jgi:hypothetical protein
MLSIFIQGDDGLKTWTVIVGILGVIIALQGLQLNKQKEIGKQLG